MGASFLVIADSLSVVVRDLDPCRPFPRPYETTKALGTFYQERGHDEVYFTAVAINLLNGCSNTSSPGDARMRTATIIARRD